MALDINSADPTSILLFHDSITPQIASEIVKRRPDGGYKNLRELETLNSDLVGINWDKLEPLIEFQVPDEFNNRWSKFIANKYGPPSPPDSEGRKAALQGDAGFEAILNQIKNRYGS